MYSLDSSPNRLKRVSVGRPFCISTSWFGPDGLGI